MKRALQGLILLVASLSVANGERFEYAPAPADNPLKGLVPYVGQGEGLFPHSMEFSYLPLSSVVVGKNEYDWSQLEKLLNDVASRGHQTVFRMYIEYPNGAPGVPQYLLDLGLIQYEWKQGDKMQRTPDYTDKGLRKCITDFIAELGANYDGDPRIGFVTAGLLGKWGEWHNHPQNEWWADKQLQAEVIAAYEAAFKTTPILLRYPADKNDVHQVSNVNSKLGYHDDSFAWSTLDTGPDSKAWHFMPKMKRAGTLDKWKQFPIGGEIRPEAWGQVFDAKPADKRIQDFSACVEQTHATWLMDSGIFNPKKWTQDRHDWALAKVRRMGYEFYIPQAACKQRGSLLEVLITVENRGVAPFYYDWPIQFALLASDGTVALKKTSTITLQRILPNTAPATWQENLDVSKLKPGSYRLLLHVSNPLPKGQPIRFANKSQDQDLPGWMTLNSIHRK